MCSFLSALGFRDISSTRGVNSDVPIQVRVVRLQAFQSVSILDMGSTYQALDVGYPRYHYVSSSARGTYHCVSHCARRAFLCGVDPVSGRTLDHRKQWIEDRIIERARVFAVAIHAYTIMSNHFHVVVEIDPTAPSQCRTRRWRDAG